MPRKLEISAHQLSPLSKQRLLRAVAQVGGGTLLHTHPCHTTRVPRGAHTACALVRASTCAAAPHAAVTHTSPAAPSSCSDSLFCALLSSETTQAVARRRSCCTKALLRNLGCRPARTGAQRHQTQHVQLIQAVYDVCEQGGQHWHAHWWVLAHSTRNALLLLSACWHESVLGGNLLPHSASRPHEAPGPTV
jgi:hypothetical protein